MKHRLIGKNIALLHQFVFYLSWHRHMDVCWNYCQLICFTCNKTDCHAAYTFASHIHLANMLYNLRYTGIIAPTLTGFLYSNNSGLRTRCTRVTLCRCVYFRIKMAPSADYLLNIIFFSVSKLKQSMFPFPRTLQIIFVASWYCFFA